MCLSDVEAYVGLFDVSAPCALQFTFDCEKQIPLQWDPCVLWWHSTKRGLHQLAAISLKR